ncbi:MAG TPA: Mth938-like domain-containing protein [Arenicellales bacterium]|nr:Mth938-like domain-containing protein [Arenicellales bacterium]
MTDPSPLIESLSWGRMTVEGLQPGKDFKLWPGGGRPWDWTETGTHHHPGIQPADVEELLDHGARAVVLSRGMLKMLRTMPATRAMLERSGIDLYIEETTLAVERYNRLAEVTAVGGLFHSTC